MLAPRVNAAGRMATPDLATRLLLAVDESQAGEARELAERLDAENTRRREEEAEILKQARRVIAADPDVGAHNMLVVWGEGWHRGVIGIVASKLVDQFLSSHAGPVGRWRRGPWLGTKYPWLRSPGRPRAVS